MFSKVFSHIRLFKEPVFRFFKLLLLNLKTHNDLKPFIIFIQIIVALFCCVVIFIDSRSKQLAYSFKLLFFLINVFTAGNTYLIAKVVKLQPTINDTQCFITIQLKVFHSFSWIFIFIGFCFVLVF